MQLLGSSKLIAAASLELDIFAMDRSVNDERIYVTLDTEMDNDPHWGKHFPPKYTSITEGIPQLLRPIWDKYNVHPIYFVSPEVLYYPPCVAILREEVQKGAIIGAHLHPDIFSRSVSGEKKSKAIRQNIHALTIQWN